MLNKTQQDYNLNADDFATARKHLPEDLKEIAKYAKEDELVLDAGCGTGYLYSELKKTKYIGVDFSEKLIKIAKERYPEAFFKKEDILNLDFPNNYFDKIFTIGVLHQIPSSELRLEFLKKMHQLLKNDGVLIIRVWNLWEKRRNLILKSFFKNPKIDFKDIFIPKNNMYYHAFSKKELEKLVEKSGFFVKKSYLEGEGIRANIYLIAVKKVAVF